jgi:hypothetical protein
MGDEVWAGYGKGDEYRLSYASHPNCTINGIGPIYATPLELVS